MGEEVKLGPAIKNAIQFLDSVYEDTSKFLQIVEQTMLKKELVSLWGANSVWDRSAAFYGPSGWLVHYLTRVYKPKNPQGEINKLAFVNVYFSPENFDQPVVVYGKVWLRLDCSNVSNMNLFYGIWKSNFLKGWGWDLTDINSLPVQEEVWKEYTSKDEENLDGSNKGLEKVRYKVKLLTEIDNQEKAEKICDEAFSL